MLQFLLILAVLKEWHIQPEISGAVADELEAFKK